MLAGINENSSSYYLFALNILNPVDSVYLNQLIIIILNIIINTFQSIFFVKHNANRHTHFVCHTSPFQKHSNNLTLGLNMTTIFTISPEDSFKRASLFPAEPSQLLPVCFSISSRLNFNVSDRETFVMLVS